MKLYMFRTVPPSIIRSFSLYTQQCCMPYRFADSLRAGSGWNVISWACNLFLLYFYGLLNMSVYSWDQFQFIVSLKYSQQDATFSGSIYFYKLLYMFQAVPPPIIRSTKLYIQRQILSKHNCCLLLSWMRWIAAGSSISLTIPDAVCTVLCSWWWAE
jgi:hypothetical protein